MADKPLALRELYGDVKQLRALYTESTANARAAWGSASGCPPAAPTSARTAAAAQSPLSARLAKPGHPAVLAQSARGAKHNPYAYCMQLPASARHQGPPPELPLPAAAKAARRPDSARPMATPRGAQRQAAAQAAPSTTPLEAAGDAPYIPSPGTTFEYEGGSSVVLPSHTDPPSDAEIQEYGQWLGLEPEEDQELLWLAREALMAPLPPYWRPCNTQDGEVYYFNFATGESLWDHPLDPLFKRVVPLEKERRHACRASGQPYEVPDSYIHATIGAFLAHLCPVALQRTLMREQAGEAAEGAVVPPPGTVFDYTEGGHSRVMEDVAEGYEPSPEEVHEYAGWLGIDPVQEPELLWVAEDGLTTPLPDPWRPCKTDAGDLYYFNFGSGETSWEHPMDEFFKKLVTLERDKLLSCREQGIPYARGVP